MASGNDEKRDLKEEIKDKFICLLRQKPIEKITVTDITRELKIHRTTFYLYYDSIYDLVQEVEDAVLYPFYEYTGYDRRLARLKHLKDHRQAFDTLMGTQNEPYYHIRLEQRLVTFCEKKGAPYSKMGAKYVRLYYTFLHKGIMNMTHSWLKYSDEISPEHMADLMYRLETVVLQELARVLDQEP